jgi:hypothetical protein
MISDPKSRSIPDLENAVFSDLNLQSLDYLGARLSASTVYFPAFLLWMDSSLVSGFGLCRSQGSFGVRIRIMWEP